MGSRGWSVINDPLPSQHKTEYSPWTGGSTQPTVPWLVVPHGPWLFSSRPHPHQPRLASNVQEDGRKTFHKTMYSVIYYYLNLQVLGGYYSFYIFCTRFMLFQTLKKNGVKKDFRGGGGGGWL